MNSKSLKFRPSVCGWVNQTDCQICGRWNGFWYIGNNESDHQRQFYKFKIDQQKQHNDLWYKQLDSLKLVS